MVEIVLLETFENAVRRNKSFQSMKGKVFCKFVSKKQMLNALKNFNPELDVKCRAILCLLLQ